MELVILALFNRLMAANGGTSIIPNKAVNRDGTVM